MRRIDAESETLIAGTLKSNSGGGGFGSDPSETFIAHALRGEVHDASEDGTGRGVPLVPMGFYANDSGNDAGENISPTLRAMPGGGGNHPAVAFDTTQITSAANRSNPQPGDPCHPLAKGAHAPAIAMNLRGRDGGAQPELSEVASLRSASGGSSRSYAIQERAVSEGPGGPDGIGVREEIAYTLEAREKVQAVDSRWAVRRLTPTECEKLQGFEPGYTQIEYRGKPAADGPRYRALGNSMAVPVIAWIGRRILEAERTR